MDELQQLMNMLGIPVLDGQMARMIGEIASNESGEISLDDFLSVMKSEGQSKHLRHLLMLDFERLRPMDCPRGHIPKGTLVKVLAKHFVVENEHQQGNVDDENVEMRGDDKKGHSGKEDELQKLSHSIGSDVSIASADTKSRPSQSPISPKETGGRNGQWTVSEIEDTIKQIPLDCYHATRHDLINFELLLNTMLGEDVEDPFAQSD